MAQLTDKEIKATVAGLKLYLEGFYDSMDILHAKGDEAGAEMLWKQCEPARSALEKLKTALSGSRRR